jgi:hypothetical protein
MGRDLAEIMKGYTIGNGVLDPPTEDPLNGNDAKELKFANGLDDFAAQLVALLKTSNKDKNENWIGNIYLVPDDIKDVWQEYEYEITTKMKNSSHLVLTCFKVRDDKRTELFSGSAEELLKGKKLKDQGNFQ